MPAARLRSSSPGAPARLLDGAPPKVVLLEDPRALDADLAGAKAANLATAARRGLPTLPGFVVTTAAVGGAALADPDAEAQLLAAWVELTAQHPVLVVRSSSTVEDSSTSSMAGQFTSVLGVRGWPAFLRSVTTVLQSAGHPRDERTAARPMAVLVQPQLDPVCGGVLFGLDPVTGDRRHMIVEAVPGTPDALVSGTATAAHLVLGRRGRLLGGVGREQRLLVGRSRRRRLARLARHAAAAFGGPQDLEWAFDRDDQLWLLQSRAVTATGDEALGRGPVLGPGPVAETFPAPLHPLEVDLWVTPLRSGVAGALRVTGAVSQRRIRTSPVVTTVGGWVAADLELFGIVPHGRGLRRALNPLPGLRRLLAAWHVGRLRAALPTLASDLLATVDSDLVAVGDLADLSDADLVGLLRRSGDELTALHGYEVLAGMLLHGPGDRSSVAAVALSSLALGREDGLSDEQLVARDPVVLALLPPAIGPRPPLPDRAPAGALSPQVLDELGAREALRLRCRWVQELTAQAADELAGRLVDAGVLDRAALVRELTLEELEAAASRHRIPPDLESRASVEAGASLPLAFRLAPSSVPVAVEPPRRVDGLAASAGRAVGVACHAVAQCPSDEPCVLVVETLDPRLAPSLGDLAALVSETGSSLSHLAILARETHVPAVVAVPDARRRFPVGTRLLVDGGTGEVHAVTEADR